MILRHPNVILHCVLIVAALTLPRSFPAQALQSGVDRFPMLKPCADRPGVLCGTLDVPENRSRRGSRKISINVAVLPAASANPSPDPLFAITGGGPGMASVPDVSAWPKAYPRLRETRHMVFVDQRGTGGSSPLDCPIDNPATAVAAFIGGALPLDHLVACRDRLGKTADLAAYTTPAAADDLEAVRRWLQFERINLYGASYGSRLALAFAQQYSRHVRSITVKGPMPPNFQNPLHTAADSQAALDRLFSDCAADAGCYAAFPKLREDFMTVLNRLQTAVPTVSLRSDVTIGLTREVFSGVIRRMLYGTGGQRGVPLAIAAAAREDYTPLQSALAAGEVIDRELNLGLFLSVTCGEDVVAFNEPAVQKATDGTFTGGALARPLLALCRLWPTARTGKEFLQPVRGRVPALIMSGQLDPQTPPRWAREMAKFLPGARIIEPNGFAHSGIPRCLANLFESFVSDPASELNTSCVTELRREPFRLPTSGGSSERAL